jgi:hypothetical protein
MEIEHVHLVNGPLIVRREQRPLGLSLGGGIVQHQEPFIGWRFMMQWLAYAGLHRHLSARRLDPSLEGEIVI